MPNGEYVDSPLKLTPFVELKHLYLVKQDTKYDPKYAVDLVFDPKNNPEHKKYLGDLKILNDAIGEALLKDITKGRKEYHLKAIAKPEKDAEGEPTGRFIIKAITKEKPIVKDAVSNLMPDDLVAKAGNGSTGRAILSLRQSIVQKERTVGITFYLKKVQIKELKVYEGGSDFDAIEEASDESQAQADDPCSF